MPASRYDIYAEQGSTFKLHLDYKYKGGTGIDLTNFSGSMQVRRSEKDPEVAILELAVGTLVVALLLLTTILPV